MRRRRSLESIVPGGDGIRLVCGEEKYLHHSLAISPAAQAQQHAAAYLAYSTVATEISRAWTAMGVSYMVARSGTIVPTPDAGNRQVPLQCCPSHVLNPNQS